MMHLFYEQEINLIERMLTALNVSESDAASLIILLSGDVMGFIAFRRTSN